MAASREGQAEVVAHLVREVHDQVPIVGRQGEAVPGEGLRGGPPGVHAVSAVCTHLGCTVRAEALPQPETMEVGGAPMRVTHRFACPCHGSRYTGDGKVVSGPAPKALAWYHLTVSPDDGQLVVDLASEVGRDFRLTVA
jgi:Rieske Fe-S protein